MRYCADSSKHQEAERCAMWAGRVIIERVCGACRWAVGLAVMAAVAATTPAQAEVQIQVYGGLNANFSSDVSLHRQGLPTDTRNVDWEGKPFDMPPYWGLRGVYWLDSKPGWGVGVEFTHSKAYAKLNGTSAGALYDSLEFTDGNNILTGNILYRFSPWQFYRIRPYAGVGIGVTIPHVEVSLVGDPVKTFEYQLAGFAGQGFVGLEMPLGDRWSGFVEAKLSYTHINGNLDGGGHIKTDLWSPHFAIGLAYRF
jgi:lipid A oxidase